MASATILLFVLLWTKCNGLIVSVNTQSWNVSNPNNSINLQVGVPGGIYTDLRTAGILPTDILYRFNDVEYRWVGYENWTYSTVIYVQSTDLEFENIHLVFHGVDTIGYVFLNGENIGKVNNMFVRYKFNVKNRFQVGKNQLNVTLLSPVHEAEKIANSIPYKVPLECWPKTYNGECQINKIRKMQSSFGWDWGPAFPSVGIWKLVELEMTNSMILRSVGVVLLDEGTDWHIVVRAWFDPEDLPPTISPGVLAVSLVLDGSNSVRKKEIVTPVKLNNHIEGRIALTVPKNMTELWWPNGYGSQKLYNLIVSFKSGKGVSRKQIRIGFRKISLIQELVTDDSSEGLTFYLNVNGVPIFAKGSNWIPSHVLPEESAVPERVIGLLQDAKEANFNMLRVWGGGLYESDLFYETCDELGIMIWQDLMFACNMYPTQPDFLSSVATEVQQQINRLQHHPSIALWAGNNENEAALRGNWYGTANNFDRYKKDYVKLYVEVIKPIVNFVDRTRAYVVSSPSNGLQSEKEGYVAKNPQSSLYGDVHYYNYLSDGWEWLIYPKTRFASEYGSQSYPSLATLAEAALPSDLQLNSEFFESRQHQPGGAQFMEQLIMKNLPLSENTSTFIYLSQINQAMSMKVETEAYRRDMSTLYPSGEGLTMGALYWQLNDVWQAPSWSSIDYAGRWKMLHYYAKKFFAPVITAPVITSDGKLSVSIVSDCRENISSAILKVNVYTFSSKLEPVATYQYNTSVIASKANEILRHDVINFLKPCRKHECFFTFILNGVDGKKLAPENFLLLSPLNSVQFPKANIKIKSVSPWNKDQAVIKLETDAIALFVWLEAPQVPGTFSENGFFMTQQALTVVFTSKTSFLNLKDFEACLTIRSLESHY